MSRKTQVGLLLLLTLALSGGSVALSQMEEPESQNVRAVFGDGSFADGPLPVTIDTIPEEVTTTTQASTTTEAPTTTLPPTTTTLPPTTTTTEATTTTQAPVSLPDYINLGSLQNGEGYAFDVQEPGTEEWWSANYFFDLPYEGGDYHWAAGDKCGYKAVYGFLVQGGEQVLVYPPDTRFWDIQGEDLVIGRFRVTRPVSGSGSADYVTRMNDTFMTEGQRHYDGTWESLPRGTGEGSNQAGFDECPEPTADYPAYAGIDERPTIGFIAPNGEVAEVRSYPHTDARDGVVFQVFESSSTQVVVGAYDVDNNNLLGAIVYYDALNGGSLVVE